MTYSPPPYAGWGEEAHIDPSSLPPASNPGTTPHQPEAAELVGAGPRGGGEGGAGRGRSGSGDPMCAICTNAGKRAYHTFTACPLTTCHKCGQLGHIQRHRPN